MSEIIPIQTGQIVPMVEPDPAFAKLTDATRTRINARLGLLISIKWAVQQGTYPGVKAACAEVSRRIGGKPSAHRLYNEFYKVERFRDRGVPAWRALYHGDPDTDRSHIAKETADFIWGWMQQNQRASKAGFDKFVRDHWRAGKPVPGVPVSGQIGNWQSWFQWKWPDRQMPLDCPPDLPRGWSYENLMRPHLKPKKAELMAARQGIAAALNQMPPIPMTRSDMRPLEFVTFDDVKFDFRIHVDGVGRPVELVGLVAFDIATGSVLGFGLRPVLLREDGSGEKLKLQDSKELIVSLLSQWGWPEYGMTIIQERGTATTDEHFQAAIAEATQGKVKFSPASLIAGTVWAGGFCDRAVGNSRAKGWLESFFNLVHNSTAALPGQTGRRYDVSPASDHGRRKELAELVKVGKMLPAEVRKELRKPYLDRDEAREEIGLVFRTLNWRRDHGLEGFSEILFWRYRDGEEWRNWDNDQPPYEAEATVQTTKMNEAPAERFTRLAEGHRFFRLAPHSAPALLECQRKVKIDRGQVEFQFQGKQYLYTPYTSKNAGTLAALDQIGEGVEVLAYFSAQDLGTIYLTDGQGRWIGELYRTLRSSRKDAEATKLNIATKKRELGKVIDNLNQRSPEVAEQREADIQHNLDVLARAAAEPVIVPMPGDASGAVEAHVRVAGAIAGSAERKRSEAAQAREDERLERRASEAIETFAPTVPHCAQEDEEPDNGL